jgi:hypothetical protein
MSSSLTTLIILMTLLHVAAFVVMIVIRLRRLDSHGSPAAGTLVTPCVVCGQPSTHRSYDGLDPNEQRDPHTGRSYSINMSHYAPRCTAH